MSISDPVVKCSYYEYQDIAGRVCRLVFCANSRDIPSDACISFSNKPLSVRYLLGQKITESDSGISVHFDNFDFSVFYTETEV